MEQRIVRLIDLLVVAKDDDAAISKVEISDLPGLEEYGALAGALLGLGAAGEEGMIAFVEAGAEAMADGKIYSDLDVYLLAETLYPARMVAAIAMLEHRWRETPCQRHRIGRRPVSSPTSGSTRHLVRYGAEAG